MEKDLCQFECLSDNERYADLINGLFFEGEQKVRESDLQELDSQSSLRMWFHKKSVKYRKLYMEEDAYDMIAACTNTARLVEVKKYHEKGGKVDMCQALDEMLADEREQGIEQGIEQTFSLLVRKKVKKNKTLEQIAEDLEEDIEVIRPIYEKVLVYNKKAK